MTNILILGANRQLARNTTHVLLRDNFAATVRVDTSFQGNQSNSNKTLIDRSFCYAN